MKRRIAAHAVVAAGLIVLSVHASEPAIVVERDSSHAVRMVVAMRDGRPDGTEWRWFADGALESVRVYRNGERIGRHRGWWPNGIRRFTSEYRNDVMAGTYHAWYPNGRPSDLRHFAGGREQGLQQSWTDDGALYLNYEAVNGRRFGLINAKPCVPMAKAQS